MTFYRLNSDFLSNSCVLAFFQVKIFFFLVETVWESHVNKGLMCICVCSLCQGTWNENKSLKIKARWQYKPEQ